MNITTNDQPSVLPDSVKQLPLAERIERLRNLKSSDAEAIEMIVDDALEYRWRERFHAGKRGGLRLASQALPNTSHD